MDGGILAYFGHSAAKLLSGVFILAATCDGGLLGLQETRLQA